jgi:thiol-disulfide isomerase/thioredoxin
MGYSPDYWQQVTAYLAISPTFLQPAFGLLLAFVSACGGSSSGRGPDVSAAASAARPADFELPRLDGGSERLSSHFGRNVVLIDFWATFCKPCLRAMPELDALYQARKAKGFVILGVSLDGPGAMSEVRAEVSKLGVTFPIYSIEKAASSRCTIRALPPRSAS